MEIAEYNKLIYSYASMLSWARANQPTMEDFIGKELGWWNKVCADKLEEIMKENGLTLTYNPTDDIRVYTKTHEKKETDHKDG